MKALQISLVAGAVFDAAFAIPLLIDPVKLAEIVRVPPPDIITFRLVAVLLLMATGFYLFAAIDPKRYAGNVLVAIIGRCGGGLVLIVSSLAPGAPGIYLLVGVADLTFAFVHFAVGQEALKNLTQAPD